MAPPKSRAIAWCSAKATRSTSHSSTPSRYQPAPPHSSFTYDNLAFDTTDPSGIKDAFEASLLDSSGHSLVNTIGAGRDAYFNITEGETAALGSGATLSGTTVTLDLAGVFAGTSATLVIRLVNNDSDHGTSVAITCVQCTSGSGGVLPFTSSPAQPPLAAAVATISSAPTLGSLSASGSGAASSLAIAQAAFSATSTTGAASTAQPIASPDYGNLPMRFEANQGQTDPSVKFLSRGSGYTLFLTATDAVLSLQNAASAADDSSESVQASPAAVLRTELVGANPTPNVSGLDLLPAQSNYIFGGDPSQWHTNVSNYGRVQYQNVYPGVDLIYHGSGSQLEYDFTIAPHVDPNLIALQFSGLDSSEIDAQGSLVLHVGENRVIERAPVIYQEFGGVKRTVTGRYIALGEDRFGFSIESYDPSQTLTIDPVLAYSTYFGGAGSDYGTIAVDSGGNIYIAGATSSTDFPTSNPIQNSNNGGALDTFVTKLNAAGTAVLYSTYLGGAGEDGAGGIRVDGSDNAYITGYTRSPDFPTVNPIQGFGGFEDRVRREVEPERFRVDLLNISRRQRSGPTARHRSRLDGSGLCLGQYPVHRFSDDGWRIPNISRRRRK